MKSIPIYDIEGKSAGKFSLDEDFFNGKVNKAFLHQSVLAYMTNSRKGTASTKRRDEVSGGGRKPWRQKGTGRARVGSIRSPIWRGGGIVFGPKPRKFRSELNKKVKSLALIQALNAKLKDEELMVVEEISFPQGKTKEFCAFLKAIKASRTNLVVIEKNDPQTFRAGRNITGTTIKPFNYINAHDVLRNERIVFAKGALENLIKLRKR